MKELLNVGLLLAACGLSVLVVASFWIPKILGWKEKLAGLTPLMRELFWTYSAYILASHLFFAVLTWGFRDWLLSGTPSAGAMSAFICFWWSVRVYLQFFGFDLEEVEDTAMTRLAKHLLTLLFFCLMILFGVLTWWNLGGAEMNEVMMIVGLVAVGIGIGRLGLPGWAGWLVVLGLVAGAHGVLRGEDPILRMAGICVVLLAAMKGLVYAVWGGTLTWGRYLVFSLGWFGMDPGTFRKRREDLSWKGDVIWGLALMVVGTLGAWWVWLMDWRQILVMFLPMSLGFHFGALRVLKGGLRRVGFPVRTLFPNLLKAKGGGDFWSRRWNVGYSQMMQRVVGRPVEQKLGREWGIMVVFLVSGLLHEVAITLPVNSGFGLPTAYFLGHGFLVVLEAKRGRNLGKVATLLLVMVPLGFLFPPEFQHEVIARCLLIFEQ